MNKRLTLTVLLLTIWPVAPASKSESVVVVQPTQRRPNAGGALSCGGLGEVAPPLAGFPLCSNSSSWQ
ncbi:MAG: hypothetical protein V3W14_10110, partial [Candidatus Neomarinimicrobiota bacterium]